MQSNPAASKHLNTGFQSLFTTPEAAYSASLLCVNSEAEVPAQNVWSSREIPVILA